MTAYGMRLSDHHADMLKASGITPDRARERDSCQ